MHESTYYEDADAARSVRISVIWMVTTSMDSASTTGAGHDARHLGRAAATEPVCKRGTGRGLCGLDNRR